MEYGINDLFATTNKEKHFNLECAFLGLPGVSQLYLGGEIIRNWNREKKQQMARSWYH